MKYLLSGFIIWGILAQILILIKNIFVEYDVLSTIIVSGGLILIFSFISYLKTKDNG